jgi:hypothetical protein
MVDTQKTLRLLKKHFTVLGPADVDQQGLVNVKGGVFLRGSMRQMPIRFGTVLGTFRCNNSGLVTLEGSPRVVKEGFYCQNNQLTSLEGAPDWVGDSLRCYENPLTSLEGIPQYIGDNVTVTWNEHLPLLRLLPYWNVTLERVPSPVYNIMHKYEGSKNPADILRCASELNEAGFEGNAEW